MKSLLQQLKPTLPLHKRASMLLFLFSITFAFKAQTFYFLNGTRITIDENTTLFVKDSGNVDQMRLSVFEGQTITQKQTLNEIKQVAFNDKKSRSGREKNKKNFQAKSFKEKAENYPKVKSSELVKIYPDNVFSPNQKGLIVSGSITIQYDLKFLIESIRLKSIHKYLTNTTNKIINDGLIFFKNYHLSLYMTRPPPFEFYL